ncbi:MAG TPA: hypothetical protein VHT72_00030, partial [Puia sp.]|nr:hypothetical protein [Puia sp.]
MIRRAHQLSRNVFVIFFCSFVLSTQAQVSYTFDFNAECRKAYQEIIGLKLNTGKQILEAE